MKNPFKEILEHDQLPEIIKNRVMKDVNLINLTIDLADLFLVKNPGIFKTVFDNESDSKQEESKSAEHKKDLNNTKDE
ncbi:hypothetical protein J2X69_003218 [Algoriphagus sp. 4150]|uniref:hypothetical protein n=1 Tax=Algoriphagus sp. 4150 TaxID=2817756 RepID=UPI00285C9A6D|nr:hypothetical protein [Algoriphagus sp. 4150]MDR7130859.1 hypothetical protein [Algoriphagus sp. 4150]